MDVFTARHHGVAEGRASGGKLWPLWTTHPRHHHSHGGALGCREPPPSRRTTCTDYTDSISPHGVGARAQPKKRANRRPSQNAWMRHPAAGTMARSMWTGTMAALPRLRASSKPESVRAKGNFGSAYRSKFGAFTTRSSSSGPQLGSGQERPILRTPLSTALWASPSGRRDTDDLGPHTTEATEGRRGPRRKSSICLTTRVVEKGPLLRSLLDDHS